MIDRLRRSTRLVLFCVSFLAAGPSLLAAERPPNLVVIFIDDMGYADIGPFGAEAYATPNLDRMAREGRVMTNFHTASAVCSESRAALLTGCYPTRVSVRGALFPGMPNGLHPDEVTIADLCRERGYATACVGKWHLGDRAPLLPMDQGFDEWFGLPYSNDMWPYLNGETTLQAGRRRFGFMKPPRMAPDLPLYDGAQVVNPALTPADQDQLTAQYTERAVDFIARNAQRPFFLYLAHTMVHIPLGVSERFRGKSGAGVYGDTVMELDWSVGRVLKAVAEAGQDENTLVLFTSDNGPWLVFGEHGGSADPLREGKETMFEGGTRVPCVVRWPTRIPAASRSNEFATTMDLLPTFARLIGADPSQDRIIDGKEIGQLLWGDEHARSPHDYVYGYHHGFLKCVRDPRWKLIFPHPYRTIAGAEIGTGGRGGKYATVRTDLVLYDTLADPSEQHDLSAEHPEVVARLQRAAEQARSALGDRYTKQTGAEVRPAGRVEGL